MIAKIAISKINYENDLLYSYKIPLILQDFVEVGKRVIVPFGRSNRKYQGYIFEISFSENTKDLKSIQAVLDEVPLISCEMIKIAKMIKSNCFCSYGEAINLMIPKEMGGKIKKIKYFLNNESTTELSDHEKDFINKIKNKKFFSSEDLKNLKIKNANTILNSLLDKKVICENIDISRQTKKKSLNFIKVNPEIFSDQILLTKKQEKIYDFLKQNKVSSIKEICEKLSVSSYCVNTLIKKNILIRTEINTNEENIKNTADFTLSSAQNEVFEGMIKIFKEECYKVSLIRGITGSGKTQIILKVIDEVLKRGKSVIFLVPEIALTIQFTKILTSRYFEKVAVMHSKITGYEKAKAWKEISEGKIKVVVGARSAIFAPVKNLGLVVIDEEHEFTYKSEQNPRFDAKDVAKLRCKINNCMMILSSATPSLESYYMAKKGKYSLFRLDQRYGEYSLPNVKIVDMNGKFNSEGQVLFSNFLISEIEKTFKNGKQSIIFLNRRGYNTFVKCLECGKVQMCPNCSVSLSYHKFGHKLLCHYCGYQRDLLETCMDCGSEKIVYLGFGTQRAQMQLEELIPEAKILRADSDTKDFLNHSVIEDFEEGKYDILLGTQMISKGFNFPGVTLVGVLMADQYLYSGDFRASEKTFSLITQTIGRAGRFKYPGKAIIQTFTPESNVLKLAAKQDYEGFFNYEIALRKLMLNPPFADICLIIFRGKKQENIRNMSYEFFSEIINFSKGIYSGIPLRVFPPVSANIEKIAGFYRYKIVIKCRNSEKFRNMISEIIIKLKKVSKYKNTSIIVDINPISIL